MATTICLLNQKGGVGKTSTAFHLGGSLARLGRRVLLVDNDPQGSLTQGFFGPETLYATPAAASVAAAYDPDSEPIAATLIQPTGVPGLAILPGSTALAEFNMLSPSAWGRLQGGLRAVLADAAEDFDLILIDCPPNLHLCSTAALIASDAIVIPAQAEDFGAQGLGPVRAAIAGVQAHANPSLGLAGYLLTMFDRRLGIHIAYEAKLRELYGDHVFAATMPLAKDYKEAVASRQPISQYKPKSAAAKAAQALAEELIERAGADGRRRGKEGRMKSADSLMARLGANMAESMGDIPKGKGAGGSPPVRGTLRASMPVARGSRMRWRSRPAGSWPTPTSRVASSTTRRSPSWRRASRREDSSSLAGCDGRKRRASG